MSEHTPGPWRLEEDVNESISSVLGPDGGLVVAGEADGWVVPFACRGGKEAAANARLVAAAPELLLAVEALLDEDVEPNMVALQALLAKTAS